MKNKNKKKKKNYIVKVWARGFQESHDTEYGTYKEAKKYYDDYLSVQGGDIEIKLLKVKEIHFSPYRVDED